MAARVRVDAVGSEALVTGRRLYDAMTDAWATMGSFNRDRGTFLRPTPPAWSFLDSGEREAFNRAARKLTPKPKPKVAP